MAQILALVGPSKSHKTWVKKQLVKIHGFDAVHAGKPVKDAARKLGLTKEQVDGDLKDEPTARLRGKAPRDLLEDISEAVGKNHPHLIGDLLQQRLAPRVAKGRSIVIDGVRTPEQAAAVRKMGGKIVRLDNGKEPDPAKPTDLAQAKIDHDHVLDVTGSHVDRRARIVKMFDDLRS